MGHPQARHATEQTEEPHRIRAGLLDAAHWPVRGATIVELRGELDIFSAPALSALLTTVQRRPDPPHLLLLLRHLAFTDSSGVGVLVGAAKRAKASGTGLALVETPLFLRQILRVTGLAPILPSLATPDEARAWIEARGAR